MPAPQPSPLRHYLPVQRRVDREFAAVLRDAAEEAERIIVRTGPKAGIGAQVRTAQLQRVLNDLRRNQHQAYGKMTKALEAGLRRSAAAAAESTAFSSRFLMRAAGHAIPEYEDAVLHTAVRNVATYEARAYAGIPLSEQVYRTEQLSNGLVDRQINRGILLGHSAKDIAKSVRALIRPDVRGGVSYAAMRLGRTELNNAFHRSTIDLRRPEPWTEGFKWSLSGSHPRADDCDGYANDQHYPRGEGGVFLADEVPEKPHPNCLCFVTTEVMGEDEFVRRFTRGDFDTYIDQVIASDG